MRIFGLSMLFFCLLGAGEMAVTQSTNEDGDGTLRRINVPILMYHYVSSVPEGADIYRIDLSVAPDIFRAHMQYLHDNGYQTISLYDLHQALNYGVELPVNPIILTFDDGHIDHYVTVFPILQEFGFTGTFFIITDRADANDPAHLNWSQIQEMAAAGMSMEAHTRSHRDLRGRDVDFLVFEIVGSLESLAVHTRQPIGMFAYPSGQYDDDTLRVLNSSTVLRAVTTQFGAFHTTDNTMELPRLRISDNLGVAGLEQLLRSSR